MRLWPLSRRNYPKQFLALTGENSLLQQTLLRLDGLQFSPPLLICQEEHRFIAAEQVRQIGIQNAAILLEPAGRNTAPAIALAALHAVAQSPDALLLILPADHLITNEAAFQQAVQQAEPLAHSGNVVTFGIVPTAAETGYGYIQRGEAAEPGFQVKAFVEKPDRTLAEQYLTCGQYYWNSGMCMLSAARYLELLTQYEPAILHACRDAMSELKPDLDFIRIKAPAFMACPDNSIDYAIFEPLSRDRPDLLRMLPLAAGWSDVGGFSALWQVGNKDQQGNVSQGDVWSCNTSNCYIHAGDQLVATVGVADLVVVSTKDAVLVTHKEQAQDVKDIVAQLKASQRPEVNVHREVYRPWGKYDAIDHGERFQVKRITVKPGARLSVQMHHHRAEHWIVVSGTARVSIDGKEQILTENQSVYIPIAAVHALENPGKVALELIEVQSGAYLGEDDIVRFDDQYGRS